MFLSLRLFHEPYYTTKNKIVKPARLDDFILFIPLDKGCVLKVQMLFYRCCRVSANI